MSARTKPSVLVGVLLLGVAVVCSAVFVRRQSEVERPTPTCGDRSSAASPQSWQPLEAAPSDLREIRVGPDHEAGLQEAAKGSRYETVLLKSTATRRHWRVDPREIQAVEELRDSAFRGLVLSAHFGGGLRVEQASPLKLGLLRDLETGDVVREINGIQIRDEAQFRLLAGGLWKKTGVLRAAVDRAGSALTITYQREGAPLPPAGFR